MKNEIWKSIKGYEGLYEISSLGRVKSLNYKRTGVERILKPKLETNGYLRICLWKDGKMKFFLIHRLVAEAFIPNPHNYPQVNHKNEDKTDNRVENLEWISAKDNLNYGTHNARVAQKNSIPVCQFDKDGNFLKEWESFREVERELKISNSSIVKCCKGKHNSAGGFKWEYKKAEK